MNRILSTVLVAFLAAAGTLYAQKSPNVNFNNKADSASYALGQLMADQYLAQFGAGNPEMLRQGLSDGIAGKSALSEDQFQALVQWLAQESAGMKAAKAKAEGKAFLEKNAKQPGVVTLPSGLQYKVITEGSGESPKANNTVTVHYEGTLINGKVFDSSYKRGQTIEFGVTQVIKGWTEALMLMKPGAKWQLFIPAELAYGDRGAGSDIGPGETLIFTVELFSFK